MTRPTVWGGVAYVTCMVRDTDCGGDPDEEEDFVVFLMPTRS